MVVGLILGTILGGIGVVALWEYIVVKKENKAEKCEDRNSDTLENKMKSVRFED